MSHRALVITLPAVLLLSAAGWIALPVFPYSNRSIAGSPARAGQFLRPAPTFAAQALVFLPSLPDGSHRPSAAPPAIPTPPALEIQPAPLSPAASTHHRNQALPASLSGLAESRFPRPARPGATSPQVPALVDPKSIGAFLMAGPHLVQVEATTPQPGNPSPALHLAIHPGPPDTEALLPAEVDDPAPPPRKAAGFTHEEELFRTKWGWAAYDAVRRAAFEPTPDS